MHEFLMVHDSACPKCTAIAKEMARLPELNAIRHVAVQDREVKNLGLKDGDPPCLIELESGVPSRIWKGWRMRLKIARTLRPSHWPKGLGLFVVEMQSASGRPRMFTRRSVLGGAIAGIISAAVPSIAHASSPSLRVRPLSAPDVATLQRRAEFATNLWGPAVAGYAVMGTIDRQADPVTRLVLRHSKGKVLTFLSRDKNVDL